MRKCRPIGDWMRRCQHMVHPSFVPKPLHDGLWFGGEWGRRKNRRAEDLAYLFDQQMGRLRIPYFMRLAKGPARRAFLITVAQVHASQVEAVIARLERRAPPKHEAPQVPAAEAPPNA
jgi:hypothetical protein